MFIKQMMCPRSGRASYLVGSKNHREAVAIDTTTTTHRAIRGLLASRGLRLVAQLRTGRRQLRDDSEAFTTFVEDLGLEPDANEVAPFRWPGLPDLGPVRPWVGSADAVIFDGPGGLRELRPGAPGVFDPERPTLAVEVGAARMRLAGLPFEVLPTGAPNRVAYRVGPHLFTGTRLWIDHGALEEPTGPALFDLSSSILLFPGVVHSVRRASLAQEREARATYGDTLAGTPTPLPSLLARAAG